MNASRYMVLTVIVCHFSLLSVSVAAQDSDSYSRYEQALRAAELKDFERAYDISVKLVGANLLFYEAKVLRAALASILKKKSTEDPQVLLGVLKREAPAGSNPERDVRELISRLTGTAGATNETSPSKIETPDPPRASLKDITPPKIVITSPLLSRGIEVKPAKDRILKQSGSNLTVIGQATDESGVLEVSVQDLRVRLDKSGNFSAEVSLQVGDNQITVTATDVHGNRTTESFTVRREVDSLAVGGRYFALVIGNNRYPNLPVDRQLKTAIKDAQEITKLLVGDYGFETKLLLDAKRAEIIKSLNEYRRILRPDDNLLIYYAGHGYYDNATEKAYWLPADAEVSDNANWIIADDVTANVKAIPARHILIISDSCYSGTLTRAAAAKLGTPAERDRYLDKMRGGVARILMASGGNEPVADGGGSGHSVFARALLDGMRRISEQVFTAEELFHQYVREMVAGKSEQTPEYNPLRNSGHEAGDFVFVRKH